MKHIANSREYTYNFVMGEFFVVSLLAILIVDSLIAKTQQS